MQHSAEAKGLTDGTIARNSDFIVVDRVNRLLLRHSPCTPFVQCHLCCQTQKPRWSGSLGGENRLGALRCEPQRTNCGVHSHGRLAIGEQLQNCTLTRLATRSNFRFHCGKVCEETICDFVAPRIQRALTVDRDQSKGAAKIS